MPLRRSWRGHHLLPVWLQGLGDCMKACQYDAITRVQRCSQHQPGRKCKGCGQCVAACPKGLISFVPLKKQAVVRCANCDKGAATTKVCKVGCIGCMKCVRACEVGAVKVENFHATVDRYNVRLWKVCGGLPPALYHAV